MSEQFFVSPSGQVLFAVAWTCVAALFAWIGLRMIVPGHRDRQFRYMFNMFRETERPFIFKVYLYFLTVWTGLVCLFVPIGCIFIIDALVKLL